MKTAFLHLRHACQLRTLLVLLTLCLAPIAAQAEKIDFNTADSATLQTIPGIGESKANKIIEYREKIGGFSSTEQLLEVSGIGEAILRNIREYGEVAGESTSATSNKKTNNAG